MFRIRGLGLHQILIILCCRKRRNRPIATAMLVNRRQFEHLLYWTLCLAFGGDCPMQRSHQVTGNVVFSGRQPLFFISFIRWRLLLATQTIVSYSFARWQHSSRLVVLQVYVYWIPPFRRIPPLLWIRVRNELGFYLVERGTDGVAAYSWYHRQFWEAAERRYLCDEQTTTVARRAIADYFDGLWVAGRQRRFKTLISLGW